MNHTPLVDVRDLNITFKTKHGLVHAVKNVSFSLQPGETVALVGESGSGKSVTARALLFPEDLKSTGIINFNGENLVHKTPTELRKIRGKEIGCIFQDPMTALNPLMTVESQIDEVLKQHTDLNHAERGERVLLLLSKVGISDPHVRKKQYPFQLSGGMRQRVLIAIAIACNPKLLIADEPTTALDVTIQAQILELLKQLKLTYQMALLFITHDLGVVAGIADRVLVMQKGSLVEAGPVDRIFYNPIHPYTQSLIHEIRS